MLNTRSLVNWVRYKKNVGWRVGFGYPFSTGYSQHVQRGQQAQHCLIGREGQWSLTQCGQRQLPPSMLCSLPCPPGIVSIEYAISVYFCIFNIAHCIDGVDSRMPANPGHCPRVISSACYVQSGEPVVILYHLY